MNAGWIAGQDAGSSALSFGGAGNPALEKPDFCDLQRSKIPGFSITAELFE